MLQDEGWGLRKRDFFVIVKHLFTQVQNVNSLPFPFPFLLLLPNRS